MFELYRSDPIFKLWNQAESYCHQLVSQASPQLKSYLIDILPAEKFKLILSSGRHIAITNTIVVNNILDTTVVEQTNNSFYGVYYYPYAVTDIIDIHKDFNCFINRMDPIRQSWLYQLLRRGLFDRGYVSFNMDISRTNLKNLPLLEAFDQQFNQYLKIFKVEHQQIRDKVPYKNFVEGGDLTDAILDSKFSIILETYFDNNDLITYTEKIFRGLQLPRPWILFTAKHGVHYLRQMGFDVFDDIVDHSYDNISSAIDRQIKILDVAEQLVNIDLKKIQPRLIEAAMHNQNLMKDFAGRWQDDYQQTIAQALTKL